MELFGIFLKYFPLSQVEFERKKEKFTIQLEELAISGKTITLAYFNPQTRKYKKVMKL